MGGWVPMSNSESEKATWEGKAMRILGIFRNGHMSEQYWREKALYMAASVVRGLGDQPAEIGAILERAEEYLKFIQTGKAHPPL